MTRTVAAAAVLVTQAEYGRRRGISREAVRQRTVTAGGPIPVHGPRKQIDPAEADALWEATQSPQGAGGAEAARLAGAAHEPATAGAGAANGQAAGGAGAAVLANAHALTQARTATMLVEAQLRRLRLEERRGQLLDRQAALARIFAAFRAHRDAWLAWPARIGPELAADLRLDAARVMIALEPYVRRQLEELADAQLDLGGRHPS